MTNTFRTRQEIEKDLKLGTETKYADITSSVTGVLTVQLLLDIRDLLQPKVSNVTRVPSVTYGASGGNGSFNHCTCLDVDILSNEMNLCPIHGE